MKTLLSISVSLLLSCVGLAYAQETPPALSAAPTTPSTPAEPSTPVAPAWPVSPSAPVARAFAFGMESGNFMGIVPEEITKENMSRYGLKEQRGVAISRVIEGSPAQRAGLRKDDVILRFDNETVTTSRKLNRLIGESELGHIARLGISRGGVEQEISVALESRSPAINLSGTLSPEALGALGSRLKKLGDARGNIAFAVGSSRRIGVSTERLTKQLGDFFGVPEGRGLLVTTVNENSAASRAGLKAGDVITEVDGQQVSNPAELSRAINRQKNGEVTLSVIRHKGRHTIRLTPEAGNAFEFSPEIFAAPEVGEVSIPSIEIQPLRNFEIRPVPEIHLQLPKLSGDIMPQLEIGPIGVPM